MAEIDGKFVNDIIKEYPDHLKIIIYHEGYFLKTNQGKNYRNNSLSPDEREKLDNENRLRSIRRSRMVVKDYLLANRFDFWCTFTLNCRKCVPKCDNKPCICEKTACERYNPEIATRRMKTWLRNQKSTHSPNLKYLVVPEFHSDGAIHFHAVLANFNGRLRDSGRKTKYKQTIYNASGYYSGFTQFVKIGERSDSSENDYKRIASYISKYITKTDSLVMGNRRYLVSHNLVKPTSTVNGISAYRMREVVKNYKPTFINGQIELQEHLKSGVVTKPQRQTTLF